RKDGPRHVRRPSPATPGRRSRGTCSRPRRPGWFVAPPHRAAETVPLTLGGNARADTREKVKEAADQAAGKAKSRANKGRDNAKDLTDKASDKAKEASQKAGDKMKEAGEKLEDAGR